MSTASVLEPPPLDVETPKGFELIHGVLREKVVGKDASRVATRIIGQLFKHCEATGVGEPLNGDTAYRCFPDRLRHVRKPDASFIRRERLEAVGTGPGEFEIAPDLVVEVISPNEPAGRINAKVDDFRRVGVPLIWVIDPENRLATIYSTESIRILREDDILDGGDVIPGFRLRLGDVLLPPTTDA